MNISEIAIEHVKPASERQKEIGILASFNINYIDDTGQVVFTAKEATLRKSRAGSEYICPPYRQFKSRDSEDNKRVYSWYLYANVESSERDKKLEPLIKKVKDSLNDTSSVNNDSNQTTRTQPASSTQNLF